MMAADLARPGEAWARSAGSATWGRATYASHWPSSAAELGWATEAAGFGRRSRLTRASLRVSSNSERPSGTTKAGYCTGDEQGPKKGQFSDVKRRPHESGRDGSAVKSRPLGRR